MNSVVNFVVVKLINKPAVQQTLENTIFVDNKRAREQTNVLPKEIETVVFRKKIMKRKWKTCALDMYLPIPLPSWLGSQLAQGAGTCIIFPPKTTSLASGTNKQTCFLQRQITQKTNKIITKPGK